MATQPRLSAARSAAISATARSSTPTPPAASINLDLDEISLRSGPGQPDRDRVLPSSEREYNYELGGDYEFGLGGGRLKLIGLSRFEHSPFRQTLIQTFADGRPHARPALHPGRRRDRDDRARRISLARRRRRLAGQPRRRAQPARHRERPVRAQSGRRFRARRPSPTAPRRSRSGAPRRCSPTGGRSPPNLTLQASLGGEYSRAEPERRRRRSPAPSTGPRASSTSPGGRSPGLDISARIERVVGQLNFFDFVASANVSAGTTNAGNANLVPPQSWNAQIQATRNLGRWGTVTARLYGRLITDIVDIIPIGATGQSPGNLDGTATVYGLQWTSTFNFDPIGWRGAKLDVNLQFQRTALDDPLTGAAAADQREHDARRSTSSSATTFRSTDWAYGVSCLPVPPVRRLPARPALPLPRHAGQPRRLRRAQGRVRADRARQRRQSARHQRELQPHLLRRPPQPTNSNILFTEDRDRFYGPVFTLTISGTI